MSECTHLDTIVEQDPSDDGCHECLRDGGRWVHLRMCQQCGHVGCCDNSPGKHSSGHARQTGHPLIRSFEPGETWFWCFPEELFFELDVPPGPHHS